MVEHGRFDRRQDLIRIAMLLVLLKLEAFFNEIKEFLAAEK